MKITLLGAAGGEVTGSAYLVETDRARVLVDFGAFQGGRSVEERNKLPKNDGLRRLDAVLLTHAHLDHTGRMPLLARIKYARPIFGTAPTFDLADLIMRDAAHLHEADVKRENRRRAERHEPPLEVDFSAADVALLRPLYRPVAYETPTEVADGITARFVDAGHILGSASIELTITDGPARRVVVFSGDIGPRGAPIHRDPTPFKHADLLFLESTYGDRLHRSLSETVAQAHSVISEAVRDRGRILIPTFAIGRAQILIYLVAGAFARGELPTFPVFLDSPMAIEATRIYREHSELYDDEALALVRSGRLRAQAEHITPCPSADDSHRLNDLPGPLMILAGSGMCNGGRILHHLRHGLPSRDTTVLIVGFQSQGTLGRRLVDGANTAKIFGMSVPIFAKVKTLNGMSGHADQAGLLEWFASIAPSKPRVVLTHGENRGRTALARLIGERHGIDAHLPELDEVIEL